MLTLIIQFVNPVFLTGLLAIFIPVVIHLFNFRKFRKEYFTNVELITELKQETQKKSRLRHLLILALRILAISSLVFAFAQPYISKTTNSPPIQAKNAVSVYVDNSFSMDAVGNHGALLAEARRKAHDIVLSFNSTDLFQLLTNDFENRHQQLVTREEFLTLLEEVKISPTFHRFNEILNRQSDLLKKEPIAAKSVFLVSDFQKSAFQPFRATDSAVQGYLAPLKANPAGNSYIDSCWFDSPVFQTGHQVILSARIVNTGEKDVEKIPVRLMINGKQKSISSCNLSAGTSQTVRMAYINQDAGIQQCEVEIQDYPVTYDDHFFFSYKVKPALHVLSLNGSEENRFLNALFGHDSTVTYLNVTTKSPDYSRMGTNDLIILNAVPSLETGLSQELRRYVENGGALCIVPSQQTEPASVNPFLSSMQCPLFSSLDTGKTRVAGINLNHAVFTNVFELKGKKTELPDDMELPSVYKHFPIQISGKTLTEGLMHLTDNSQFLTCTDFGKGKIYLFSVPFDPAYTNFMQQALFIPTLYNIALKSNPSVQLSYTVGKNEAVQISSNELEGQKAVKLRSSTGNFEIIPEQQQAGPITSFFVRNELKEAGNYFLLAGDKTISGVSFNYDRGESNLSYYTADELEQLLKTSGLDKFTILDTRYKPVSQLLTEMHRGKQLWKIFVWLALIFLLAEIVLLRFWQRNSTTESK